MLSKPLNGEPRTLATRAIAPLCLLVIAVLIVSLSTGARKSGSVSTAEELARAISNARSGEIINVAGGVFGGLLLTPKTMPAVPFTIRSADPRAPAIFSSITLRGGKGVRIQNVQVVAASHDPERPYLIDVVGASDLVIDGVTVHGAGGTERLREYGMWLRGVTNAEVRNCLIQGTRYGIGMLNGERITIARNGISGVQTDGIRGGGINDLLVEGNVLTGFLPKQGEHPDGIQLWSTNQTTAAKNITIRDNLVARGNGRMTQGIFIRDTLGQLPFENVVIERNLVVGTMYNGIAVLGVRKGRIADNRVAAYPDQKSWIRLDSAAEVAIESNRAPQYLSDRRAWLPPGNLVAETSSLGGKNEINAWLEARPWTRTGDLRLANLVES